MNWYFHVKQCISWYVNVVVLYVAQTGFAAAADGNICRTIMF